ncbi:Uncharacterized protein TPAR_05437 [Tolypocladium paradoxum]|uniref:Uncharacterized protein n=1 Tax=Tolypocladium paradoxum TaxID=94208 RepID=A0A2S4KW07_9HYPO|nr:Uncharacterized protein TPAR_05437 [Tolypocladium paradoxum]
MLDDPEVEDIVPTKFSPDPARELQQTEGVDAASTRTTRRAPAPTKLSEGRREEDDSSSDTGSEWAYDSDTTGAIPGDAVGYGSDTASGSDGTNDTDYNDDDLGDADAQDRRRLKSVPGPCEPKEDEEPVRKYKALCYEDIILWIIQDPNKAGRDVLAMEVLFRHHKGAEKKPKPQVSLVKNAKPSRDIC